VSAFFHVTNTYFVHTAVLVGPVVFAGDALYLVRRRAQLDERVVRMLARTSPVAAITSAIARLQQPELDRRVVVADRDLAEFPDVVNHPDWPSKHKTGPVFVIQREDVPFFIKKEGGFWVTFVGGIRYAFNSWICQADRLKTFLEANKWSMRLGKPEPKEWENSLDAQ